MEAEKEVVLITGCSGGLGAALVRAYLDAGYYVFATVRDLNHLGGMTSLQGDPALQILALDVCDAEAVSRVVGCVERRGRLDVLVANAGLHVAAAVESADIAQAESLFNTNFFGVLRCVQAVLPIMRRQKRGRIIGVSSLSAQIGLPCDGIYAASKAALEKAFESLRAELSAFGVGVSVVVPASFPSKLLDGVLRQSPDKTSPYFPLLANLRAGRESASGGDVSVVVAAVMNLMRQPSAEFRVPGDERAASVLAQIYRMSDQDREAAVAEWSDTAWWSKP